MVALHADVIALWARRDARVGPGVIPDVCISHRMKTPKPLVRLLIINTYTPCRPMPAKIIYVARDDRRVVEYYSRYVQRSPASVVFRGFNSPQDVSFRSDLRPSPWHEHVDGWLGGLNAWKPDRFIVLKYEDLVRTPTRQPKLIAHFVGKQPFQRELRHADKLNSTQRMGEVESQAGE